MTDVIRIPNLPMGHIVEQDGMPTDDELTFRQVLITNLQRLFGNEGVVPPSQSTTDILEIENSKNEQGQYKCQYGTLIYDTTTNKLKVALPFFDPILMITRPRFESIDTTYP